MGCGSSSQAAGSCADDTQPLPQRAHSAPNQDGGPPDVKARRNSYKSPEMSSALPGALARTLQLSADRVASYSNHGIKPGIHAKAIAKINQDRGLITYPLSGDPEMALMCVYDGHGTNGEQAATTARLLCTRGALHEARARSEEGMAGETGRVRRWSPGP